MADEPANPDEPPQLAGDGIVASMVSTINGMLGPLLDAAVGYRVKAIGAGFPEHVAAQMAADYHAVLVKLVVDQVIAPRVGAR